MKAEGDAGKIVEDQSELVKEEIPKWTDVAVKEKRLDDAVDGLFALEKKCRNGEDHLSGQKVAVCLVELCFGSKDFEKLEVVLQALAKKRGQLKQVVQAGVQKAMELLLGLGEDDKPAKISLIEKLREITEGKIYVENERARLTKQLADIREGEGKVKEASQLLQDVQVETYGAMDKREKAEFILEQIRLCLDSNDNIRALILSDKISAKLLADPQYQDIKLKYHRLMIRYYQRKENYLAIARAYLSIHGIAVVQENPAERATTLQLVVLYTAMAPYDGEQADVAQRVKAMKELRDLPAYQRLLHDFVTMELIAQDKFESIYTPVLEKLDVFAGGKSEPLSSSSDDIMADAGPARTTRAAVWTTLKRRIVEHNIRVISAYYSRIEMDRLCGFLSRTEEETERCVADLVASKSIYARINRADGIVVFSRSKQPNEQLNEWSSNIGSLLQSLERVSHLIQRERMVHKVYE
mmetsp:Transcript_22629/g.63568  ORF Transcript_22629/g.63568 Transcript_22629/m.63568 type:complete len:468 (+) Transcript_22629:101-1504(+)